MRQLWLHPDPPVEKGRDWQLSMQCLWTVHQDEWPQQTSHQAPEESGEWLGEGIRRALAYLCPAVFIQAPTHRLHDSCIKTVLSNMWQEPHGAGG